MLFHCWEPPWHFPPGRKNASVINHCFKWVQTTSKSTLQSTSSHLQNMQWLHKLHVLLEFMPDKTLGYRFCQISQNLSPIFKPELLLLTPKVCHKIVKKLQNLKTMDLNPRHHSTRYPTPYVMVNVWKDPTKY
jgi:hypothetical protein